MATHATHYHHHHGDLTMPKTPAPWKPHDIAMLNHPTRKARPVEIISHPCGNGTILIRMVPTDPTTLATVMMDVLSRPNRKYKYIHVGRCVGLNFLFPEDMLRYDDAHTYDHDQLTDIRLPQDGVIVYRLTELKQNYRGEAWTYARWLSFGTPLQPIYTKKLGGP